MSQSLQCMAVGCTNEIAWAVRVTPTPCCGVDHEKPSPWLYCTSCLKSRFSSWGEASFLCPKCATSYNIVKDRLVSVEKI